MPYRAYYLDTEGELHRPADGAQIRQALDSWGVLWVDVENTTEEDADLLIDVFGFHPLAVERCIDEECAPTTESEPIRPLCGRSCQAGHPPGPCGHSRPYREGCWEEQEESGRLQHLRSLRLAQLSLFRVTSRQHSCNTPVTPLQHSGNNSPSQSDTAMVVLVGLRPSAGRELRKGSDWDRQCLSLRAASIRDAVPSWAYWHT